MIKRAVAMTDGSLIDNSIATYINNDNDICFDVETAPFDEQVYDLRKVTNFFERMIIETSMEGVKNTRQLAQKLNVSQATIIRKMKHARIKFRRQKNKHKGPI